VLDPQHPTAPLVHHLHRRRPRRRPHATHERPHPPRLSRVSSDHPHPHHPRSTPRQPPKPRPVSEVRSDSVAGPVVCGPDLLKESDHHGETTGVPVRTPAVSMSAMPLRARNPAMTGSRHRCPPLTHTPPCAALWAGAALSGGGAVSRCSSWCSTRYRPLVAGRSRRRCRPGRATGFPRRPG